MKIRFFSHVWINVTNLCNWRKKKLQRWTKVLVKKNMADGMWYCLQCRFARFKSFNVCTCHTEKINNIFWPFSRCHYTFYTHSHKHNTKIQIALHPSNAIFVQSIEATLSLFTICARKFCKNQSASQPAFVAISIFTVCINAHAAYKIYTYVRMYRKTDSEKWFSRDQNAKSMMLPAEQHQQLLKKEHIHIRAEQSDLLFQIFL